MNQLLPVLMSLAVAAGNASARNQPDQVAEADGNVQLVQYLEYFEKGDSGLQGDTSYLLISDQNRFLQIFREVIIWDIGYAMSVAGSGITDDTFESKVLLAVLKRGNRVTTFYDVQATRRGETLVVSFKSQTSPPQQFGFNSRLVASVPREKFTRVEFVENGKVVATHKIPAPPEPAPKSEQNGSKDNKTQPPALPVLPNLPDDPLRSAN